MIKKVKILIIGAVTVSFLSGCSVKHFPRYVLGTYVSQPKEGKEGRYSRIFDCPYPICYEEVQKILKEMGVVVSVKNKHMISAMYFDRIYKYCIDTTEVGIFFKEINSVKTQIDVACGNYGLAKFVSEEMFFRFKKLKINQG